MRISNGTTDETATWEFLGPDVVVGAAPPADLVLPSEGGAQVLAVLFEAPDGWRVRDLGVPDGIRLFRREGAPLLSLPGSERVHIGDVIELGDHRIEVLKPRTDASGVAPGQPQVDPAGEPEAPARPRPPPLPVSDDVALVALLGAPTGGGGVAEPDGFRPHLEVFERASEQPRKIPLGKAPILFGGDADCHVHMAGLMMPDFVAAVETLGEQVTVRPVTVSMLGPKVVKDGRTLKDETRLEDGERVFIGEVTVFARLRRRR